MQNFLSLTEIQKMLTFSPIKTWREFNKLRQNGKLKEGIDWVMRDKKTLIDMPRFFSELESIGYKNIIVEEYAFQMKTDDNKMLSNETIRNQNEIIPEEKTPENKDVVEESENKRNQVISDETTLKSNENERITTAVLEAKNETITELKKSVDRAEKEAETLRKGNLSLMEQVSSLTNITHRLMAPRQAENREQTHEPNTQEPKVITLEAQREVHESVQRSEHDQVPLDDRDDVNESITTGPEQFVDTPPH